MALPEIRESDASPEIRAIYEDIKQVGGLPQVNLIFRYLATKPGALDWVWQALRPLYSSQELVDAVQNLWRSIERDGPSPIANTLSAQDEALCQSVLSSYNSGNSQNLFVLIAFIRALEQVATTTGSLTPKTAPTETTSQGFVALPRREDLSAEALAIIGALADKHGGAPGVVPSMYLHLALWPPALDAASAYLLPMLETPAWTTRVFDALNLANTVADDLAPSIHLGPDAPDAETLDEIASTISAFIAGTIPEMIIVGRLLAMR